MNDSKHTGETIAGVTVQMRFIPLNVDTEQEKKFSPWSTSNELITTIKTRVDDTKKATLDNLREFQLPTITRFTSEGETFIKNKVKLIDTIFTPKGWLEPTDVTKRLDKYASFMSNVATTDFAICQRCARAEFIDRHGGLDEPEKFKLRSEQNEFLEWLKRTETLVNLGYLEDYVNDNDITSALDHALEHYERAIMYHIGTRTWDDHRNAFRLHKKYYCNHLMKPFSMKIADFNERMKEYGALLRHLPPPSSKTTHSSFEAYWEEVSVTHREIRAATYDALPKKYQDYINYNCKEGWQEMSDQDFLQAMMAHEYYDNTQQFKRTQREKKRKRDETTKKSVSMKNPETGWGRKSPESGWSKRSKPLPTKVPSEIPKSHSTPRVSKFCQYCKDNNRKYWTHNTEECYLKKPARESNAIEALQKEFSEVKNMLKSLKKNKNSDSDSDE